MTTIKDIARLSGYSIGTVSRVINRKEDVSEEAKRIIFEVIRRENYQPNQNAKLLKQNTSSAITIFVKGTQNTFLESILEEIQRILRKHCEETMVVFLDEEADEVEAALHAEAERKPKGLIFLGGNLRFFQKSFAHVHAPSVLVSASARDLHYDNLSSFATDDCSGAREAADYLLKNGHRVIGIVGGSKDDSAGEIGYNRVRGAIERIREAGLPFDENRQHAACRFSMDAGWQAASRLIETVPDMTAIFAVSDMIAIGALRAIRDKGMRVPQDISLIGYDGIEHIRYTVPRLATIQQNITELASRSVEDLLFRLNYEKTAQYGTIPYRVIAGESVAPAPGKGGISLSAENTHKKT